jgi:ATP-dependent helicase/nuclease subunit B
MASLGRHAASAAVTSACELLRGLAMRITFGHALDGPNHPEPLGDRRAAHGELRVGPLGLLTLLETHCGLGAREGSDPGRIGRYRTYLERADDGDRFYSRSFAADPLGVA